MVSVLLRVLCLCMVTSSWVQASRKSFVAEIKTTDTKVGVGEVPSESSIWSSQLPTIEPKFIKPANNGSENSGAERRPACCSCGKDNSMSRNEADVKAARLNSVTELLKDKMRLPSDEFDKPYQSDAESGEEELVDEATLSKLPQAVLDQTLQDDSEPVVDDYYAWDKQIIEPGHIFVGDCPHLHSGGCYSFNLSDLQAHRENIQTSRLWLHKTYDRTFQHKLHEIVVFELVPSNTSNAKNNWTRVKGGVRRYPVTRDSWLQVDLTGFIQRQLQAGAQSVTLAVACETCNSLNSNNEVIGAEDGFKPLLITNLLHKPTIREKRSEESCISTTQCCKKELDVNIRHIGLHSIFQPLTISIGYCFGFCGDASHLTANHTKFKEMVRRHPNTTDGVRNGLETCCVPTVLKPVNVMKIINGHHVLSTIPNAQVVSCGCL